MTTVHREPDGTPRTLVKGAPEVLVPPRGPASVVADRWAADGARVLAVTSDGVLLGLLAMADPVRPEAAEAVSALHRAGIDVVLVTGDHLGTATAVARQVGVLRAGEGVGARVHARVEPAGKLDLVSGWQAAGHVVAMTGDGVNDAPALRAADIGVAMGRRGTEVAKEAADLVLVDDSLATVTAAVAEGRRVFDNVRRFVGYGLAGGLAEVLVMLLGPVLGLALPLLPAQVLWVNLLTHGPVGVAMGGEPAAPDVLARRPRDPAAGCSTGHWSRSWWPTAWRSRRCAWPWPARPGPWAVRGRRSCSSPSPSRSSPWPWPCDRRGPGPGVVRVGRGCRSPWR